MAVLVEAISVIIKVSTINSKFPGGWSEFRDTVPDGTLCSDGELARLGFMTIEEAMAFIGGLEKIGFVHLADGQPLDLAIADQQRGFDTPCEWADFGRVNLDGHERKQIAACRLAGSNEGIFLPDEWTYEKSLSSRFLYVSDGWVPESLELLRHEEGLDVYRDLETGKELYVGRTDA